MSLTHPLSLSWPWSLNEKVWLQIGKLSQQSGKVSQQTGKVSQHRFAVKWQVTRYYGVQTLDSEDQNEMLENSIQNKNLDFV